MNLNLMKLTKRFSKGKVDRKPGAPTGERKALSYYFCVLSTVM